MPGGTSRKRVRLSWIMSKTRRRAANVDGEMSCVHAKITLGKRRLDHLRQRDEVLDFALEFSCAATNRSAAAAMAASSPKPGSQCTSGSLRNQVICRLA